MKWRKELMRMCEGEAREKLGWDDCRRVNNVKTSCVRRGKRNYGENGEEMKEGARGRVLRLTVRHWVTGQRLE